MGTPKLSNHPLGTHARMDADDNNMHYPKGFIAADDNTGIVKGNDSELYYKPVVQTDIIELTSAEILALNSSPKTLIAAPGANRVIKVCDVSCFYEYGSAAYSTTDNLEVKSETGKTSHEINYIAITDSSDRWTEGARAATYTANDFELKENEKIILTSASDPTGGDGTLKVFISYIILER